MPRQTPNNGAQEQHSIQRNATNNQNPPQPPTPIIVQTISPAPNESTNSTHTGQSEPKAIQVGKLPPVSVSRDFLDYVSLGFTALLLIVGSLGVRAAYRTLRAIEQQAGEMKSQRETMQRQLRAMQGQLAQMESAGKQTDELIRHASNQVTAFGDAAQALKESAETGRLSVMYAENSLRVAEMNAQASKASTVAFIHAQRPWLTIQVGIASALTFDEHGAHITLNVTLQNIGHMPAEGVWLHPVLSVASDAPAARRKICSELSPKVGVLGPVVFPGQTWIQNWRITANASDIDARCREIFADRFDDPPFVPFSIIVAAQYTAGIEPDAILYTAAIYDLRRTDEKGSWLLTKREDTPADSLYLQLSGLAGIIAK